MFIPNTVFPDLNTISTICKTLANLGIAQAPDDCHYIFFWGHKSYGCKPVSVFKTSGDIRLGAVRRPADMSCYMDGRRSVPGK